MLTAYMMFGSKKSECATKALLNKVLCFWDPEVLLVAHASNGNYYKRCGKMNGRISTRVERASRTYVAWNDSGAVQQC